MKILSTLLLTAALGGVGMGGWQIAQPPADATAPPTVTLPAGVYNWRPSGDWLSNGRPVSPPLIRRAYDAPLEIMAYHVTRGAYAECLNAGACPDTDTDLSRAELPMVGVSFLDAEAYAAWLSDATGATWRLPSDEEWQRAAAERFVDDAVLGGDWETYDPGKWLTDSYARNIENRDGWVHPVQPAGAYGVNSRGLHDLAGNVWEWTSTCQTAGEIADDGTMEVTRERCFVRVVAGQHRAMVLEFVRDAKSGGCGAGVPPDYLGFRLVRES